MPLPSPEEPCRVEPIITTIEVTSGWVPLFLGEVWAYRELVYFMVWRDLKIRYTQTIVGVGWAILQPFLTMIVFSIFFGGLAKMPSDGLSYPVFSYAGLVPWVFFANGLTQSANSLVGNAGLITKVYFPRLTIPIAAVLSGLPDFCLAFLVLLALMVYFGATPTIHLIWLPLFLLLALVTSLGMGLWLAALNVEFRDVRHVLPFAIQLWLFATPIAYPSSLLHEPWRTLYGLNPMVGVVEGFRWALLGTHTAHGAAFVASAAMALAILVGGAYNFRRMERTFADVL